MLINQAKKGILLVNLGSPNSYEVKDVKPYLNEFLMDERVIDLPLWLRKFLVQGIILNTRPPKSAKAYKKIWWDEGSPLIVISKRVQAKLAKEVPMPVGLGMRYGNPSIKEGFEELLGLAPDLEEVLLIPLYPHYAMSSYETVVVKAEEVKKKHFPHLKMDVLPPFYNEEKYISVLGDSMRPHIPEDYDHLLFSYHGVPERHIKKGDVTKKHCLKSGDCCDKSCPEAQTVCYRHQVIETSKLVAKYLEIPEEKYTVAFQSRLGPDPWLKPYTAKTLEELPEEGVKNLAVVCPAFVSDCLETIEEIGMEGQESFLESGGEAFTMIPCLNDQDPWVHLLADYIQIWAEQEKVHV
ncbi:MAG: ferrochelatase [Bacteroidota bacterium]